MHLLIGLLVAAVLGYLIYRALAAPQTPQPVTLPGSSRGLAFLSNGLLFFREPGGALQQLHSPYAQEAEDRRERAKQRHGWKKGTAWGISGRGGMRDFDPAARPTQATSAVFERSGDLLYFLKEEAVGGLFRREAASGNEQRIFLKQGLHLSDLTLAPEGDRLAAASQNGPTCNVILVGIDGNGMREVTGGDSIDTAPTWIPGVPHRLLFQSCGLARNEEGFVVAQGPATIQTLDMQTGTVSAVLDDPRFDHLRPRVCSAGNLHFIRRPHEASSYGTSNLLLDTLLFPFRLLRAVFHYLNFFSMVYSRKPLTSASGPELSADAKDILLQGRRIDAQKALREARSANGIPSLVPASWELVRRDAQGREQVLATHVASYDLGADGTIVHTNGRGVFVLEPGGGERLALTEALVADVVAAAA